MSPSERWRPTPAHARAIVGGLVLSIIAVVARRPDLLVLATPLLVAACWATLLRPDTSPEIRQHLDHTLLQEGDATTWHFSLASIAPGVEDVIATIVVPRWIDQTTIGPPTVVGVHDDEPDALDMVIRPTRWGSHALRPAMVVAASGLNGFRYVSRTAGSPVRLLALPRAAEFDAIAPPVRTLGLVGVNRSPRPGSGTEFASIRPFQPGDRLKRIHWPETLRSGTLHVASTWADHDRSVVLLVDAFDDIGVSDGVDGRPSSLDITVRAAAAIANHYIQVGDRVTVMTIGTTTQGHRLGRRAGTRHLRRVLELLATIEPGHLYYDDGRLPRGIPSDSLVVMLSPLVAKGALNRLVSLTEHNHQVAAIDCLPSDIADHDPRDPYPAITWRIELLQRERHLRRVRQAGTAVVPWRGPGSLDLVLRSLQRRPGVRSGRR